jgi:hypothetical protein
MMFLQISHIAPVKDAKIEINQQLKPRNISLSVIIKAPSSTFHPEHVLKPRTKGPQRPLYHPPVLIGPRPGDLVLNWVQFVYQF